MARQRMQFPEIPGNTPYATWVPIAALQSPPARQRTGQVIDFNAARVARAGRLR